MVTVPVGQDYAAQALLAELQEKGVDVDLVHEHNPLTRRRNAGSAAASADADALAAEEATSEARGVNETAAVKVEDMNPLRIFDTYMGRLDSDPSLAAALLAKTADNASLSLGKSPVHEQLHAKVLEEGRLTIERLLGSALNDGSALGDHAHAGGGNGGRVKELRLDKVSLSNFGPYGGDRSVEYPLSSRGLVLIRGQSTDGTGADSNGAGKVLFLFHLFAQRRHH